MANRNVQLLDLTGLNKNQMETQIGNRLKNNWELIQITTISGTKYAILSKTIVI